MFAFTSLGMHCDQSLSKDYHGIYTFRVQGQMYHYINPLVPPEGQKAKNLQLYFFVTDHETVNRLSISSRFRQSLITKIEEILKLNPYFAFFRGLQNLPNIDDYKIVLNSNPDLDYRVFNRPTTSQVGAVWTKSEISDQITSHHIQVYGKNGETQIIKHYYACYDSLQYPLIFANGEPGWHPSIERVHIDRMNPHQPTTCAGENLLDPHQYTSPDQLFEA